MTTRKIYNHPVIPMEGLDPLLKKCFLTHLTIYNYSLELLKDNPQMSFQEIRERVFRYVEDNKIQHLHIQIVQNEIYYQYKKFRRNTSSQKLLSSIQYFTLIVKGFNNGIVTLDDSRTKLRFVDREGYLLLPEPLPDISCADTMVYLNLSYSSMENQFVLSIFEGEKR